MLRQYVRNSSGEKIGLLTAEHPMCLGNIMVSWSKCFTKHEPFDKRKARAIAQARAIVKDFPGRMPREIRKAMIPFLDRCMRYFRVDIDQISLSGDHRDVTRITHKLQERDAILKDVHIDVHFDVHFDANKDGPVG